MGTPHWKPKNVTLTGNSALRKPQNVSACAVQDSSVGGKPHAGFEVARQALIRMQKINWAGYESLAPKRPKVRKPRQLKPAEVQAWMVANKQLAATMLAQLAA